MLCISNGISNAKLINNKGQVETINHEKIKLAYKTRYPYNGQIKSLSELMGKVEELMHQSDTKQMTVLSSNIE